MSSSRRQPKRPARVKAPAKGASAKGVIAKRLPPSARRPARTPATSARAVPQKSKPAPAPKPAPPLPPTRPALPGRPAIRLAGSASSRLTIKPGAGILPRPQLELSTKRRPSGPRRLSEVELDEEEVLVDPFDATLDGSNVRITAVLERTCVYVDKDGDRRLARKVDLWVEADKLPIRRRGIG